MSGSWSQTEGRDNITGSFWSYQIRSGCWGQVVLAKEAQTASGGTPGTHHALLCPQGRLGLCLSSWEQSPPAALVSLCVCAPAVWEASSWTRLSQTPTSQGWLSSHPSSMVRPQQQLLGGKGQEEKRVWGFGTCVSEGSPGKRIHTVSVFIKGSGAGKKGTRGVEVPEAHGSGKRKS